MPTKKNASFEIKIALLAVGTSIAALCISGYQAYMQRLQTYASVLPSLLIYTSTNYNTEITSECSFELSIVNKGVGPAKIDSISYKLDGKSDQYLSNLINILIKNNNFATNELWRNRIISPNEAVAPVWLKGENAKKVTEIITQSNQPKNLTVDIHYSSIFNEKWKAHWSNISGITENIPLK